MKGCRRDPVTASSAPTRHNRHAPKTRPELTNSGGLTAGVGLSLIYDRQPHVQLEEVERKMGQDDEADS